MITLRHERLADVEREALLHEAFGDDLYRKASERLREDRLPAEGLAFIAAADRHVVGTALVRRALAEARKRGHAAIVLVGDAAYYSRFGFSAEKTGALWMPGPFERHRLLALELVPGALEGARGLIGATRQLASKPDLAALVAQDRRAKRARRHHAHAA
jgi:predicted N-acetyltransferase YhbS